MLQKPNKQQFDGVIRHLLTMVGAILLAKGHVTDATWLEVSGATTGIAGIAWSYISKK